MSEGVRGLLQGVGQAQRPAAGEPAGKVTAAEFQALYAQFGALGRDERAAAVAQLKDPAQPFFDFNLAKVLEDHPGTTAAWAYQEYQTQIGQNRGLAAGTVLGQLKQWLGNEHIMVTGQATAFDNVNAAMAHAKTVGAHGSHDAVVVRDSARGLYFVQPVSELATLDGPNAASKIRDNIAAGKLPSSYALVAFSDGSNTFTAFSDATVVNKEWYGGVLGELKEGAPIVAIGGHGTFYAGAGPDAKGNHRSEVGGHVGATSGADIRQAAARGDVRAVLFIAAGCNTAEYAGKRADLGPSFLEAKSAQAFVGTRGFMQNGAHMGGIRRILDDLRRNPTKTLDQVIADENRIQGANRMQDAAFVVMGNGKLTYADIVDLASGRR